MQYQELNTLSEIKQAVEKMGFTTLTEIQEKAIPVMQSGKDIIAKAPTGTGKTCAFGIPVIERIDRTLKKPQAVILAPTRELAQQIAQELRALAEFLDGLSIVCVYGGADMQRQQQKLRRGCQIVVATPGRLADHIKHRNLSLAHVQTVVLDEADEMLGMGFYKDVVKLIDQMKNRKQLAMFSATISREVMDIGWLYQRDAEEITVQPKQQSKPKIFQYQLHTTGRNKIADLTDIITQKQYQKVMVFCNTKFTTTILTNQLIRYGFEADCLHGDMSQKERNQILETFRDNKLKILVATDVAARGLDIDQLEAVFNYDVPTNNENYTHRIGRTGRAGKEGEAYLLYTDEEQKRMEEMLRLTRNTAIPVFWNENGELEQGEVKKNDFQIRQYF